MKLNFDKVLRLAIENNDEVLFKKSIKQAYQKREINQEPFNMILLIYYIFISSHVEYLYILTKNMPNISENNGIFSAKNMINAKYFGILAGLYDVDDIIVKSIVNGTIYLIFGLNGEINGYENDFLKYYFTTLAYTGNNLRLVESSYVMEIENFSMDINLRAKMFLNTPDDILNELRWYEKPSIDIKNILNNRVDKIPGEYKGENIKTRQFLSYEQQRQSEIYPTVNRKTIKNIEENIEFLKNYEKASRYFEMINNS